MWTSEVKLRIAIALCCTAGVSLFGCSIGSKSNSSDQSVTEQSLSAAYIRGTKAAQEDLLQSTLKVKVWGMPEEWLGPNLFEKHLKEGFTIELVRVAECLVTDEIVDEAKGYNDVAVAEIEKRYGKGILERVHADAVGEFEQTRKKESLQP